MATRKRYLFCRKDDGTINEKCPHEKKLKFNDWIREKCPESNTGFINTDIDFLISDYNRKVFMLIESKTNMADYSYPQRETYNWLDKVLSNSIFKEYEYRGIHLIQFEKLCFDDGKCYLDKKEITEEELIDFLSFK